ncbi:MAG: glycosyltransferase family 39 protein [PVC group bacterium]
MKSGLVTVVFLLFLLVRIFVPSPDCFLSLDEAKYLTLARSFPRHLLFNNQFYTVHPPLFPGVIRLLSQVFPDHIAGIAVSLLFSVVTFWALVCLFRLLGKDRYWITIALFILAVSPLHIPTSRVIYKDSLFLGLFTLSLYLFVRGVIRPSIPVLLGAGGAAAACCLTSDLALSLVPCFAAAYFIFRPRGGHLKAVLLPVLLLLAVYGCWLGVRWRIFTENIFYPAGVDGMIEYVHDFTARHLFTPRYFPATRTMFNFSPDLSEFRINANVYPLSPLIVLPGFMYTVFYAFIAVIAVYGVFRAVMRRRLRRSADLFFAVMLALFSLPVILHPEPRFLIPVLLPMSYFFARGLSMLAGCFTRPLVIGKVLAGLLVGILAAAAAMHLTGARRLVFLQRKEVEAWRTAAFLDSLPGDGVMAQVGYPPELAYLTGKRVLALPVSPAFLDDFIRRYSIQYLLYGQRYLAPLNTDDPSLIWCYYTIKHIRAHPEKYPLIRVIEETYRSGAPPDLIFVHGVRRK